MDPADTNNGQARSARMVDAGGLFNFLMNANSSGVPGRFTLEDIQHLLQSVQRDPLAAEDEEESEDDGNYFDPLPRDSNKSPFSPAKEPQQKGKELLMSGDFGFIAKPRNIARSIMDRMSQARPRLQREIYTSHLAPNSNGTAVAHNSENIYTAQYSADSSFYYTCDQNFQLNIYDTTKAPKGQRTGRHNEARMPLKRSITAQPGRWTITSADLAPANDRIVYSSIMSTAYLSSTTEDNPVQIPIPFADPSRNSRLSDGFGIWSVRFSADGNELVAGGDGRVFVYDLIANRRTVAVSNAHKDDINSCCWADSASGNVLISASDDSYIKVWDRRSLSGQNPSPSGVLIGNLEGITCVNAKGDGRYVISNGKDQTLRLWDLRMMCSNEEYRDVRNTPYSHRDFDYRYPPYRPRGIRKHPNDCSVMSYQGHSVLRTLIRCYFSPQETTGGKYIYSGSADGKVYIWSLDGTLVQALDTSRTLPISFDPSGPEPEPTTGSRHSSLIRDVSWHSQEPVIMSAAWNSGRAGSTIARHEWKGASKMSHSLTSWYEEEDSMRSTSRTVLPGTFVVDDEEEDEDDEDEDDDDWMDDEGEEDEDEELDFDDETSEL